MNKVPNHKDREGLFEALDSSAENLSSAYEIASVLE